MAREGLTIKQEKYAQGLFSGLTQREAYKQAYNCENMTDKSIDEVACVLAADLKVSSRIQELEDELRLRNMATVEKVLSEMAKVGFTAVDGARVNDKLRALEMMGKHLGMFTEKVEVSSPDGFKIDIKIVD